MYPAETTRELNALHAAEAALLLGFGRLNGMLALSSPEIAKAFAIGVLRWSIRQALDAGGFRPLENRLTDWLSLHGEPPTQDRPSDVSPAGITGAVLAALERHPWPPLAEAATAVARALPHLVSFEASDRRMHCEHAVARVVQEADRAYSDLHLAQGPDDPISRILGLATRLGCDPDLAPALPSLHLTERPIGSRAFAPLTIELPGSRGLAWCVGLFSGSLLRSAGLLAIPLPSWALTGAVLRSVDLDDAQAAAERRRAVVELLGRQAVDLLALIERCRLSCDRAISSLTVRRSNSRTGEAFAWLGSWGPLRRSHLARLLGLTDAGVDGVVESLRAAGLAFRCPKTRRIIVRSPPPRPARSDPGRAIAEYDAAVSALDAVLTRNMVSPDFQHHRSKT